MMDMFNLEGKSALVLGGAGYLAWPICQIFADHGAAVTIADINEERAKEKASQLKNGSYIVADAGDAAQVEAAVKLASKATGKLDILVNATWAGSHSKPLDEMTPADMDASLHSNVTGAFITAKAAAAAMSDGGAIIFFSSMYGLVSPDPGMYQDGMNPNPLDYGVAKAAIVQMTKYLAVAWAKKNIRVNAIAPGPFPFPQIQEKEPGFTKRLCEKTAMKRVGRQHEIAGAALYLAAQASSFMTGQVLSVDGGWTVM